jgi:hypothetical protein
MPFQKSTNIEEVNAIINAEYDYGDPYWYEISQSGKFYERDSVSRDL